jgi:hypothetical protein
MFLSVVGEECLEWRELKALSKDCSENLKADGVFFSKNMYDFEAGVKLFVQRWRIRAR